MAYESILPTDTECNFIFIFLREWKICSKKYIVLIENQWPVLNKSFII
jgi:hypothetical protein